MIKTDLGAVTAYAYAVTYGQYEGTEQEFGELLADSAENAEIASSAAETAIAAKEEILSSIDPLLSAPNKAADARAAGDIRDKMYVSGSVSVLMNVIENSQVSSSNGVISANSSYNRSDYTETRQCSRVYFPDQNAANPVNICFYDKDKRFLFGYGQSGQESYSSNPEAYYFIVTMTKGGTMYRATLTDTVSTKEQEDTRVQNLNEVTIKGSQFPNNLINYDECIDNCYVNYNDGKLTTGQSNYFATGFIPVVAGHTYRANHGRNYAWYNSSKTYISGLNETDIQTGIVAPGNAAYIRFTVNKTSDGISNPYLLYFTDASNYSTSILIPNISWCAGKKVNWLGDSLVDGDDFDEIVASALGLVKSNEYGINGSTIALNGDGTNTRDAMCARYSNMSNDADIIVVSGGTNDWMYAWCPIGTIDDPDNGTSNTTFYGATKTLCKGLIDKYPQKLICFTTPIKRAQSFANGAGGTYTPDGVMTTPFSKNKYGLTLGDYADIIKEVCGYYSIPVLDMYRESLLNPHISSQQNMFDNVYTHPNATGQKIMARRVAGWLNQLGYIINGL